MTEIFGVEKEQMRMWLCNRKIITAQESVVKPLTMQQVKALFTRNVWACVCVKRQEYRSMATNDDVYT